MLGSLVGLAFGIDGDLRAGSIVRNDFFGLGLVGIPFEEVELVLLEVRAHVGIERLSLLIDKPGHIDRLTCFELRLLFGRDVASQHLLGDTQFFLLCLFLPFGGLSLSLSLLGRAETKFNRPLVGIELKVGIEMLSRLGGHTFHIDASAFREFFFLPVVQLHALDFIGDAYPIGTQSDDVVGQAVDAHEAAGRLIFAGEGQFHGTTEVARFLEGFLVLIGECMPEELTLQLRLLADGMDNGNECSVSGGFQGKTGIGIEGNFDNEVIMSMNPDLILVSPFKRGGYETLKDVGIPLIPHLGYKETTPLGQAEWIKFVGLLLGIEKDGNERFATIEKRYNELKELTADGKVKKRPIVFSGELRGGNWYAVGGKSFLAQLFKDAGADYFLKDDERSGGVTLDFETVYNQADDADYWRIVNSFPGTFSYEALKEQDPRYEDFRAFREKGIIYCNMKNTPFYESMPTEPEIVLADLLHIFHPDLLPDHESVYYSRLK